MCAKPTTASWTQHQFKMHEPKSVRKNCPSKTYGSPKTSKTRETSRNAEDMSQKCSRVNRPQPLPLDSSHQDAEVHRHQCREGKLRNGRARNIMSNQDAQALSPCAQHIDTVRGALRGRQRARRRIYVRVQGRRSAAINLQRCFADSQCSCGFLVARGKTGVFRHNNATSSCWFTETTSISTADIEDLHWLSALPGGTRCCILSRGSRYTKSWSKTQSVITLSSAESGLPLWRHALKRLAFSAQKRSWSSVISSDTSAAL